MATEQEHLYNAEHIDSICEPCFAFRQQWTHVAGQVIAWETAIGILNQVSAEHFIADRMDEAHELKQVAKQFGKKLGPLKNELDKFIKERHRGK